MLLLFSGPATTKASLASLFRAMGVQATEVDITNVDMVDQNLLDDAVWTRIKKVLADGVYDALFAAPPCRTFSEARRKWPAPPVLRTSEFPYGFPKKQAQQRGLSH